MNNKIANLSFRKGDVIVLTDGAYSDFRINAYLVSIVDFDMRLAASEFNAKTVTDAECLHLDNFGSWLVANGYAMPVDYREVYLGDHNEWHEDFNIK